MQTSNWVTHLRESFAAVAAGARVVPMGDNGQVHQSLASKLAEMRVNAALGRIRPAPRRREPWAHADDVD